MDNIKISLSESSHGRDISEVRVDGVIDTLTAGELEEVIDALLKRQRYNIIIDLAGVDYISSAGWGIFISHIKDVRGHGGDIKLANMVPDVYEIFELLEFDNVLQAYSSLDEAIGQFRPSDDGGLKKKVEEVTRLNVVERAVAVASHPSLPSTSVIGPGGFPEDSLESTILHFVRQDPFSSIGEIKAEINRAAGMRRTGYWQVFGVLRRHKLLRRKARFRFAWRRV